MYKSSKMCTKIKDKEREKCKVVYRGSTSSVRPLFQLLAGVPVLHTGMFHYIQKQSYKLFLPKYFATKTQFEFSRFPQANNQLLSLLVTLNLTQ